MFDWREFFGSVIFFSVVILIVCLISGGFYMMCATGNAWGFALVVGGIVLGGGIAAGFGL